MSASGLLFLAAAAALFGLGVFGVLTSRLVLRKLLALNLLGTSVFLLLVLFGQRDGAPPDPVPQALVLTGMVVAVAFTGLALALLLALQRRTGRSDLDDDADTG